MLESAVIASLIKKWNPHFENIQKKGGENMVEREGYLKRIWKAMDLRHIIILTGVRRSGKSTLMKQLIGKLIKTGTKPTNILYLYFEDLLVQPFISMGAKLAEEIYSFYLEKYNPQGRIYVFLDELQGVKGFNHWLHTHYEFSRQAKFIVSGSRRSLVDSDTATLLTGRNVQFDIYPFNFSEYLKVRKVEVEAGSSPSQIWETNFSRQTAILHNLGNYLYEGGYPEIVLTKDKDNKIAIANSYYRDILNRDVVGPNSIRAAREIEILGLQIMADFTKTHTYRSLGRPQNLSVDTIKSYLDYFSKAYLFFESNFFSYKTKEAQDIRKAKKIYTVDNGLRNFNTVSFRPDLGQCAENIVYMELKKNSTAISYWQGKHEVDFAVFGPDLSLFNVAYTNEPHGRETAGMLEGLKTFKLDRGTILTKNYFDKKEIERKKIEFIPLWAWLIAKKKH